MMTSQRERERRSERVSGRRRAEEHKTGYGVPYLRLPEGVNMFRVDKAGVWVLDLLPYRVGDGNPYADRETLHFERTFFTHRGIGADNASYACPRKVGKQACPICEARAKLAKDPEADEDLIADLSPKERQLWALYDLKDMERGLQIWDVSYHLFGKRLDAEIKNADEEDGYEFFADLKDGMTLKVGFDEKSFAGNSFYDAVTISFRPRRKPYDEDILDQVPCLDELLVVESYDKLKAVFLQTEQDEPVSKKKQTKRQEEDDWEDEDEGKQVVKGKTSEKQEKVGRVKCPACTGSGKSSKGGTCRPCEGSGYLEVDEKSAETSTKTASAKEEDEDEWDWENEKKGSKEESKPKSKQAPAKRSSAVGADWDE